MYRIGFDVGGTFTDFTLHDTTTGMLRHFKVPSTPADPSEAIEDGLRELLATLRIAPDAIGFVGHGTTVATNMVIERWRLVAKYGRISTTTPCGRRCHWCRASAAWRCPNVSMRPVRYCILSMRLRSSRPQTRWRWRASRRSPSVSSTAI